MSHAYSKSGSLSSNLTFFGLNMGTKRPHSLKKVEVPPWVLLVHPKRPFRRALLSHPTIKAVAEASVVVVALPSSNDS